MPSRGASGSSRRVPTTLALGLLWVAAIGAPLARGGVDPELFAAVAVAGGVAFAAVAWTRRKEGLPLPASGLALLGGSVLAALSLVPLPGTIVRMLSPRAGALASLPPEPAAAAAAWSLDPPATAVDLVRLTGLCAIVFAAAALARRERTAERLVMAVAASSLVVGGLSGLHLLANLDHFLLLLPMAAQPVLPTPFVNPNHAASLFVLGTAASLGLAVGARPGVARAGWWSAAFASAGFATATLSNGGIAALVVACVLFASIAIWRARVAEGAPERGWLAPALVAMLGVAAVIVAERLMDQLHDLDVSAEKKSWPWLAAVRLVLAHPVAGVGRGAFEAAFHAFAPVRTSVTITHPENVLLHWAAEWGLPAAIAGVLALGWTWLNAVRSPSQDRSLALALDGLLAGSVAVFVHDLADFGLEFAGVGVPFAIAIGVLGGRVERWRVSFRWAAPTGVALAAVAAVGFLWGLPKLSERELSALPRATPKASPAALDDAYRAVRKHHPADPFVALEVSNALLFVADQPSVPLETRREAIRLALPHLARAQELSTGELAHRLTARALLRAGRRAQALTELRLAYLARPGEWPILDAAIEAGATPSELASLPRVLLDEPDDLLREARPLGPAAAAAALVAYLYRERHAPAVAVAVAEDLLADREAPWSTDEAFLSTACQAMVVAQQADPAAAAVLVSKLESVAATIRSVRAAAAGGYWCGAQARYFANDPAGGEQLLREGLAATNSDPGLATDLAQRLLSANRAADAAALLANLHDPPDAALRARLWRLRVTSLRACGRVSRAVSEASTAANDHPREAWARALFAAELAAEGTLGRAADEARAAAALSDGPERDRYDAWARELAAKAAFQPARPAGVP